MTEAIAANFPNHDPAALLNDAARYFAAVAGADPTAELDPTDVKRGFIIAAAKDLYRKALEIADYSTALKALKSLQSVR